MRDYELVVLYHPDLEIDLENALKKVESAITAGGGQINHQDNWGKRKMAYQIKKQDYAIYVYYEISMPAEGVVRLENALNIAQEAIRYLITQPVPKVEAEEAEGDKLSTTTTEETEASEDGQSGSDDKED